MSHNVSSGNAGGVGRDRQSLLQKAAAAVGAVFLLVGILGFIPGITQNIYPIDLLNTDKQTTHQELLGIFEISVLHNLVHLLFGVAGLLMARTWNGAKNYLVGGGVVYLVLWLYGLVVPKDSPANFVPVNAADDWLHFVLGLGMVALGVLLAKRDREANNAYAR
jgi:hypothetical protein